MAKEPIPPPSKRLVRVGDGVSSKPRNFAQTQAASGSPTQEAGAWITP